MPPKPDPKCVVYGKIRFKPLPPALARKCVQQFQAGKTAKQIAKDEHLGHLRVRHAIKEAGVDITQNRRKLNSQRLRVENPKHPKESKDMGVYARIERLAAQGMHPFDIAYEVGGISSDAIIKHLAGLKVSA